jgi:hypothetical protein
MACQQNAVTRLKYLQLVLGYDIINNQYCNMDSYKEKIMKWVEIKQRYPDQFILLGNLIEEQISSHRYKILEAEVLKVSDDAKEIRKAYQEYNNQGKDVLYSLPSTTEEFIVENVPLKGIFK